MLRCQILTRTGVAYSSAIPFKVGPYRSQGNFLPLFFHLCALSKSLKVKIYKTIIIRGACIFIRVCSLVFLSEGSAWVQT
jgi:hypothetical protein